MPLFIKLPGQSAAHVVTGNDSLNDVLPTVLDAVAVPLNPTDSPVDGVSLLAALRPDATAPGTPDTRATPSQELLADIKWKKRCVAQSIDDGAWKLIHVDHSYAGQHDADELYATGTDPGEAHDVAAEHPDEVLGLRSLLSVRAAVLESCSTLPENH